MVLTLACEDVRIAAEYFMERLSMLLMPDQSKSHVVDARFVTVVTWICLSFDMDLTKQLHEFVKVVIFISRLCQT